MRAHRLKFLLVATIALLALGACSEGGNNDRQSDKPAPTTVAPEFEVTEKSSQLTEEILAKLCRPDPSTENAPADTEPDNSYAAVAQGLGRALGQICRERENT